VPTTATRETQIIAIYGKGGIGKSFTLANLSYMLAQQAWRAAPVSEAFMAGLSNRGPS
jgi:septum formation inhibitor-activating ATPase MinD